MHSLSSGSVGASLQMHSRAMSTNPGGSVMGHNTQFKGCSGGSSALDKLAWSRRPKPMWRSAGRGLNIEGICKNPTCDAHGKTVIHKAGFTSLDLTNSAGRCRCPCCHSSFIPATVAFSNCEWKISGTKQDTQEAAPEDVDMESWEVAGNQYERFKEDADDKTIWTKLVITTRPVGSASMPAPTPPGVLSAITAAMQMHSIACSDRTGNTGAQAHIPQSTRQPSSIARDPNMFECAICYGAPLSRFGPTAINTPCGHCFHRECLKPWVLAGKGGCPSCRRDIKCLAVVLHK